MSGRTLHPELANQKQTQEEQREKEEHVNTEEALPTFDASAENGSLLHVSAQAPRHQAVVNAHSACMILVGHMFAASPRPGRVTEFKGRAYRMQLTPRVDQVALLQDLCANFQAHGSDASARL